MCGFAGFIAVNDSCVAVMKTLDLMSDLIAHRGPDGSGNWVAKNKPVGLAHRRLSIIDLSAEAAQPMLDESSRFVIAFNGEIYNYLELRQEIGESFFKTRSDTEVILKAFMKWGSDCVRKLRGMFAFAIWDNKEQTMFFARDRFGIKPLYWMQTSKGLYFASESKALVPFLEQKDLNSAALSDYFSFQFCVGEKTLIKNINQFPAAHSASAGFGDSLKPKRYWEVHYNIDYNHDEKWFVNRLKELMHDSVHMHLRADVEVGSYISGGVDSSLVASLARAMRPNEKFQGFNGRFLENHNFDESPYAQKLADQSSINLHITDITEKDFVENISNIIWYLDQPAAGPGVFPQFMVSKEVGKHIKVVLGGQGGDEIFGGYARYLIAYFEECIKGAIDNTLHNGNYIVTYESIIPNLQTLKQYKPLIKEFWAAGLFEERDQRYWRLINRANTFGNILAPDAIDNEATFEEFRGIFWGKNVSKESYFDSMTHFDFKTLLPSLLQVEDRVSMAHGVESRVPFLDHPLVEFVATIPADIKFRNGELKRLLRTVFAEKLPPSIINRKDKMGFPVPLNLWLTKGGLARDFIGDIFSSNKAKTRSYLGSGFSLDRILNSQSGYGRNLWALLSLELWHQQFMDDAPMKKSI